MIFIKIDDIPFHISIQYEYLDKDVYSSIKPNIEDTEPSIIKQWLTDNNIEYELCGHVNFPSNLVGTNIFWDKLGIKFFRNADAVLFKLRWS